MQSNPEKQSKYILTYDNSRRTDRVLAARQTKILHIIIIIVEPGKDVTKVKKKTKQKKRKKRKKKLYPADIVEPKHNSESLGLRTPTNIALYTSPIPYRILCPGILQVCKTRE